MSRWGERIMVAAGWVIALGLLVFFVPSALAVLSCQWALRKLRGDKRLMGAPASKSEEDFRRHKQTGLS
jgi:hypothetical protein